MPHIDDPATTVRRGEMLRHAGYLRSLYRYWYSQIISNLPPVSGEILELGSGGGFLCEMLPQVRTSDVMRLPAVELQVDARRLPFPDASLRAVVGTNVLHHIPGFSGFLAEAARALVPGGRLIFVEPWSTLWSRVVYRYLHHEPFDTQRDWSIPAGGPLSAANGALPWIVFYRDRARFESEYPNLHVIGCKPMMPFSYLLSGGISRAWKLRPEIFPIMRMVERPLDAVGLFATVIVERK